MNLQESTLSNGIRVISEHRASLETLSVGVWVDVGARYEPESLNGVSHMLEHMAFKGTGRRSARQIAEEIENVGGYLNAYTTREHTTYYARVMKNDLALAVDMLGDILTGSVFDDRELTREKEVIIQEIGQTFDTPDDLVFDKLQETAFTGQPLGRSILGTPERVRAITREDLLQYMADHYTGDSVVVSAAGNLDHGELVRMLEDALGAVPDSRVVQPDPAEYTGGSSLTERTLEQLHLSFGLSSMAFDDPDYFALQVYSTILGGGMSSRLFQEVREERGLAYSVYSFVSSHMDSGLFGIYAGAHPSMAGDLVPLIADLMKRMTDGVREEELERARAQLKAGLMMSLESTSARIEQMGRQKLIFGRVIPTDELTRRIDEIDMEAIRRVACRTLESRPSIATVGDGAALAPQSRIEDMFSLKIA